MSIGVLKLPGVKRKRETRPKTCRYCEGETFQRWGQVNKPVKDMRVRNVKVYRYRCCHCNKPFDIIQKEVRVPIPCPPLGSNSEETEEQIVSEMRKWKRKNLPSLL